MKRQDLLKFNNVQQAVKHYLIKGYKIRTIVMAFSREHTLNIGRISINVEPIKGMKTKNERAQYLMSILPNIFNENKFSQKYFDLFEKEFGKWLKQ